MWGAISRRLRQFLSFWVNQWITRRRQRKLNKLSVAPVDARLIDLLVNYTFLSIASKMQSTYETCSIPRPSQTKLGDVASAKDSIAQASQKSPRSTTKALNMQAPSGQTAIVLLQKGEAV